MPPPLLLLPLLPVLLPLPPPVLLPVLLLLPLPLALLVSLPNHLNMTQNTNTSKVLLLLLLVPTLPLVPPLVLPLVLPPPPTMRMTSPSAEPASPRTVPTSLTMMTRRRSAPLASAPPSVSKLHALAQVLH